MSKKIAQFRFFGDSNTRFNSSDKNAIYYKMDENQPSSLSSLELQQGTAFINYTPIIQLGVQGLPGTKFNLNTNLDPIILGSSGMYELDLTDSSATLTSLTFEHESLQRINECADGYLIIDIVYQEV